MKIKISLMDYHKTQIYNKKMQISFKKKGYSSKNRFLPKFNLFKTIFTRRVNSSKQASQR